MYAATAEIDLHSATQVIDAEMARRKLLEESPIPSTQEEPVLFDTSEIPWWAWVRRFHLPEVCSLYWSVAHLCIQSWQHLDHGLDLHTELFISLFPYSFIAGKSGVLWRYPSL